MRALWQLIVSLVSRYGSDFTTAEEADHVWLDMRAALYKHDVEYHPPKGTRKTESLRLGFETHAAGNIEDSLVDQAARRGDEYARRVLARSEDVELWVLGKRS